MRRYYTFLSLLAASLAPLSAQIFKIDFNLPGRSAEQVTEVGYTPWAVTNNVSAETREFTALADDGTPCTITVTIAATDPASGLLKSGWSKNNITANKGRLVNDGVTIAKDGESYDEFALDRGGIQLTIAGLPVGHRVLQTFNNSWENGASFEMVPMDVYLGNELVAERLEPTVRVDANSEASRCYFEFDVEQPGQEIVVRFMPHAGYVRQTDKAYFYNRVFIDGFEIGLPNRDLQARNPFPADHDMHAPVEGRTCLSWSAASADVALHTVYFGTDSLLVAEADADAWDAGVSRMEVADTSLVISDVLADLQSPASSMHIYYWRVDQTTASGTTRGQVWQYRPRRLAFRTAEGYGRFAIGGRGGRVVHVTNLNDSGEGSFRWALTEVKGPRTIVFDVSGVITLQSRLTCSDRYVTVAGQTAPGKGICFRSAPLGIGSDAIWRHVRMRLGGGRTFDGIGMAGADHSILDHASISWTIDEAFSSRGAKNITLQRSLISEALNVAGHENYAAGTGHGYAGSVGGDISSLHHNLLAHNQGRNWSLAGGLDGSGYYAGRLDIFNMVVYNWIGRTTDGGAHEVNFVGNYYKMGPETRQEYLLNAQLEGAGKGSQSYYYHNNIKAAQDGSLVWDGTNDEQGRKYTLSGGQTLDWEVFRDAPFFPSYATVESASDAYKSVMSDVGCTMPRLDEYDQRIIREVIDGTYTYRGSYSGTRGIIDHESDCGGYEDYPEERRAADFDSDGDGLPDWIEQLYGTNPYSPEGDFSDANSDPDGDGFTLLEDYLEYMARPHFILTEEASPEFALDAYFRNYKALRDYSIESDGGRPLEFSTITYTDVEGSTGKAYIAIARTAGETGIRSLHSETKASSADAPAYNLLGQRLAEPKGLHIRGGKMQMR